MALGFPQWEFVHDLNTRRQFTDQSLHLFCVMWTLCAYFPVDDKARHNYGQTQCIRDLQGGPHKFGLKMASVYGVVIWGYILNLDFHAGFQPVARLFSASM